MRKELALERADRTAIAFFEDLQPLIRDIFPGVRFDWVPYSGEGHDGEADLRGDLPSGSHEPEELPPSLAGRWEGSGCTVEFGLGYDDPVKCLYVTTQGDPQILQEQLAALEVAVGGTFVPRGDELNKSSRPGI